MQVQSASQTSDSQTGLVNQDERFTNPVCESPAFDSLTGFVNLCESLKKSPRTALPSGGDSQISNSKLPDNNILQLSLCLCLILDDVQLFDDNTGFVLFLDDDNFLVIGFVFFLCEEKLVNIGLGLDF